MSTPQVERFRRGNLALVGRAMAFLFGVGSLAGLVPLLQGVEPMAFVAPAVVFAVSVAAVVLEGRGRPRAARIALTSVSLIYVGVTLGFAPLLVVLAIGFPLTFLLVAMVHLVHPARTAWRLGWATWALVLIACLRQLLSDVFVAETQWALAVGMLAQGMALATAHVALSRLGVGWEGSLDDLGTLNRRLARSYESVLESSQAKSRFLASMSHELRTPLNAIIGYAELMQEDVEDRVLPEPLDLQRVQDAARHLLELVNEVLDLSRVESGRLDLELVRVDLEQLATQVVDTLRPVAAARGLALELERRDRMAPLLLDALRMRQVLTNLVGNAVKFTAEGSVRVVLRSEEGQALVEVVDTGEGIAPDALARIFQPFEQADGSVQRTHGGTGLGLAISQQLVEKMGGRLTVRSVVGQGTTFTACFPLGTSTAPSERGRTPAPVP